VYAKEKLMKRNLEFGSTKKEITKSKIVTLCHGDTWQVDVTFKFGFIIEKILNRELLRLIKMFKLANI
jgi:hypothetical protein